MNKTKQKGKCSGKNVPPVAVSPSSRHYMITLCIKSVYCSAPAQTGACTALTTYSVNYSGYAWRNAGDGQRNISYENTVLVKCAAEPPWIWHLETWWIRTMGALLAETWGQGGKPRVCLLRVSPGANFPHTIARSTSRASPNITFSPPKCKGCFAGRVLARQGIALPSVSKQALVCDYLAPASCSKRFCLQRETTTKTRMESETGLTPQQSERLKFG